MSVDRAHKQADARAYRLYAATKPTNLVAPPTYVNAAMKEPYKGNNMGSSRGNANDNLLLASRDSGAQIVRV